MGNVSGTVKDGILTLVIKVDDAAKKAAQPSKSGKTRLVASTHGTMRFGDVGILLNATIPLEGE